MPATADGTRPRWYLPPPVHTSGDSEGQPRDPGGDDHERSTRWLHLPSAAMASEAMTDPGGYLASQDLHDAIHAAILLGQPLLLTGEPGCGKTEVANYITYQLGLERPGPTGRKPEYALRFDTKSTTSARDLFYTFDTVGRFHAAQRGAQEPGADDPRRFISFNALGRAILDAAEPASVHRLEGRNWRGQEGGPRRSVVLIDEIDKAPRDVPNDLLMEMDRLAFYITELDRTVTATPALRPIVVLTSNSERALPEAFLRRCVFHHMAFPDKGTLRRIVARRLTTFPKESRLRDSAIGLFLRLREEERPEKLPGTAELLGFLNALAGLPLDPDKSLAEQKGWEGAARATLLKTVLDHQSFKDATLQRLLG